MTEPSEMTMDDAAFEPRADLDQLQRRSLVVGAIGAVAIGAGFAMTPESFYRAYLNGWLLVVAVSLGLFGLGMLNHVSGGRWGVLARRVFEAAGLTLPLVFLLGLPIALNPGELYPWAQPEAASDALIQHKAAYLNASSFLGRYLAYFALWFVIAFFLARWSRLQDTTGEQRYSDRMQRLSAGGLVVYVLLGTFASVDWIMSLDPHWFSSLFGIGFVVGQGLAALAFLVPMMHFLGQRQPLEKLVSSALFHAYGKLMLAFIMLWTYLMISQYLIIWSGNLPEEITWYLDRNLHGWKVLSFLLVIGHFAVPFLLLLSQDLKKRPRLLTGVAIWILVMRFFDFFWQVTPSLSESFTIGWLDLVAPVGFFGLWLAALAWQLKRAPIVPFRDPILKEMLGDG